MQRILGAVRLVAALVAVLALAADFDYVRGFTTFAAENWFSYFTTQSGMAAVVVLAASGVHALRGGAEPPLMAAVRAVVLSYVVVSGVVFGLIVLESSAQAYYVEVPWSSRLLHFVIPAYALLDWILAPGCPLVRWPAVGWAMLFPLAWCVFTEIRGPRVGWYPYFFMDPAQVGAPVEITAWLTLVAGVVAGVTALVVALSRVRPGILLLRARPHADPADGLDAVGPVGSRASGADGLARADADADADADERATSGRDPARADR